MVFDRCFASVVLVFSLNASVVCCVSPHVVEFGCSCSRLSPLSAPYVSSDFYVFDLSLSFFPWNACGLKKAEVMEDLWEFQPITNTHVTAAEPATC